MGTVLTFHYYFPFNNKEGRKWYAKAYHLFTFTGLSFFEKSLLVFEVLAKSPVVIALRVLADIKKWVQAPKQA